MIISNFFGTALINAVVFFFLFLGVQSALG